MRDDEVWGREGEIYLQEGIYVTEGERSSLAAVSYEERLRRKRDFTTNELVTRSSGSEEAHVSVIIFLARLRD